MFTPLISKPDSPANGSNTEKSDTGGHQDNAHRRAIAEGKKSASENFKKFTIICRGSIDAEKISFQKLSNLHCKISCRGDFGALVARCRNIEYSDIEGSSTGETQIVMLRDAERKELISVVKRATEDCEKIQKDMAEELPGCARNHDQIHSALSHLADALAACEERDDEDENFGVMQALISYVVATEKLDNYLPKTIFPERVVLVTGDEYLRMGSSVDPWLTNTDGRQQILASRHLSTRFRNSRTLGDYSHPLRPSLVLKIAKHAGGDSLTKAIFGNEGRLIKSTEVISMKPEVMAIMIYESSGRAPARGSSKIKFDDIRSIFMGLMSSDPRNSEFQLANLSRIEFTRRCELAIQEFRRLERIAGGEMRAKSEEGKSPYQNLVLVLANMPRDQRHSAMQSLSMYRNRRADTFVTSGIEKLVHTCLGSLESKPRSSSEASRLKNS